MKNNPPAMAQTATTPTTTPAAIAGVLLLFAGAGVSAEAAAACVLVGPVTTTVLTKVAGSLIESTCGTGSMTVVGLALAAGLGTVDVDTRGAAVELGGLAAGLGFESDLDEESWAFSTLLFRPVKDTVHELSPPPAQELALP